MPEETPTDEEYIAGLVAMNENQHGQIQRLSAAFEKQRMIANEFTHELALANKKVAELQQAIRNICKPNQ